MHVNPRIAGLRVMSKKRGAKVELITIFLHSIGLKDIKCFYVITNLGNYIVVEGTGEVFEASDFYMRFCKHRHGFLEVH